MLVPFLSTLLIAAAPASAVSPAPQEASIAQAVDGASTWSLPLDEVPWIEATGDLESALRDLEVRTRNAWGRPASRVVLEGGGEAYLVVLPTDHELAVEETPPPVQLVARAEAGGAVRGTVIGGEDYSSAYRVTFELPRSLARQRGAFARGAPIKLERSRSLEQRGPFSLASFIARGDTDLYDGAYTQGMMTYGERFVFSLVEDYINTILRVMAYTAARNAADNTLEQMRLISQLESLR